MIKLNCLYYYIGQNKDFFSYNNVVLFDNWMSKKYLSKDFGLAKKIMSNVVLNLVG